MILALKTQMLHNSNYLCLIKLSCDGATALVSDSLDGRLIRAGRLALRLHLLCCPGCRRFARQMTFLRQLLCRLRTPAQREGSRPVLLLPPEVRERIKKALKEH